MTDKVPFSSFAKLDIKVGKILSVENHPNADKLFILKVDLNEESLRTIVAGLKTHYKKEDLEGKEAVFIANIEPVTLRGVESNGMILAASSEDKSEVIILTPEKEIRPGSQVS